MHLAWSVERQREKRWSRVDSLGCCNFVAVSGETKQYNGRAGERRIFFSSADVFRAIKLKVLVVLRQCRFLRLLEVLLDLLLPLWVHGDFRWQKRWHCNELQVWITNQFASEPQEGLLEVVIAFRADVVVLKTRNIHNVINLSINNIFFFIFLKS